MVGFEAYVAVSRAIELVAAFWLAGPALFLALLLPPVATEINAANINLILVVAIVLGFRWPALWAIVLLTKPTMAVGLLWFVFRRDYRSLAIALGTTLAIAAVSFVDQPGRVGRLHLDPGQHESDPRLALPLADLGSPPVRARARDLGLGHLPTLGGCPRHDAGRSEALLPQPGHASRPVAPHAPFLVREAHSRDLCEAGSPGPSGAVVDRAGPQSAHEVPAAGIERRAGGSGAPLAT